jgi:hypothetical protein
VCPKLHLKKNIALQVLLKLLLYGCNFAQNCAQNCAISAAVERWAKEAETSCGCACLGSDELSQLLFCACCCNANLAKQKPEILTLNQNKVSEVKGVHSFPTIVPMAAKGDMSMYA